MQRCEHQTLASPYRTRILYAYKRVSFGNAAWSLLKKDLFGLHAPGARFNAPEAKLNAMGCRPKDAKRNGKDRNLGEVMKWIVKMISK